jgi:hypothetical protein
MLNNIPSAFTWIPYGSDHFYPTWPEYTGDIPSYPDVRPYEPHPWLPAGINDCFIAGDEMNGAGVNWPREEWGWTDSALSRPTVLAAAGNTDPDVPHEDGQTVDMWIGREKRLIALPRDYSKSRAAGRAGHIDRRHPR